MCGIYAIVNTANNKRYIGQSKHVKYRMNRHRSELMSGCHQNSHLQRAWNKYGGGCFQFVCLELCDEDNLNTLEERYISEMKTTNPDNGYNKESGGKAHRLVSEETRRKMSRAKQGMYDGEKNPMYGVSIPVSDERKKKMSERFSGKGNPMYGRKVEKTPEVRKMFSEMFSGEGNPFYGKKHTDEAKQRMRASNKKKTAVRCIETNNEYESTNEAYRQTGIHSASISRSCRTGHILAGGYHWEYIA